MLRPTCGVPFAKFLSRTRPRSVTSLARATLTRSTTRSSRSSWRDTRQNWCAFFSRRPPTVSRGAALLFQLLILAAQRASVHGCLPYLGDDVMPIELLAFHQGLKEAVKRLPEDFIQDHELDGIIWPLDAFESTDLIPLLTMFPPAALPVPGGGQKPPASHARPLRGFPRRDYAGAHACGFKAPSAGGKFPRERLPIRIVLSAGPPPRASGSCRRRCEHGGPGG
ncbi:hypothetical protein C8R47DRAFT_1084241 [Mycena vitilis]|nr:hypothetical protein C8R47DRAFT_1084241 [Mycena vitilis]